MAIGVSGIGSLDPVSFIAAYGGRGVSDSRIIIEIYDVNSNSSKVVFRQASG